MNKHTEPKKDDTKKRYYINYYYMNNIRQTIKFGPTMEPMR